MKKINNQLDKNKLSTRKNREIEAFADLNSYQELMERPYFRELKNKIKQSLKKYSFKDKKILEIGAGVSEFLPLFKNNKLTALDISETLLKENKIKVDLVVGDAENLPFKDKSFDFVFCVGILHHLENQKQALLEIKRVLKSGGKVFISEPTKWSLNLPYYLIRRLAIRIFGVQKFKNLSGCSSPDESFLDFEAVKQIFDKEILYKTEKILPLRMPPIGFLEKLFSIKINNILGTVSLINNFGTIIFIKGEKRSKDGTRVWH